MKLADKPKHKAVVIFIHETFGGHYVGGKSKSRRIIVHDCTVNNLSRVILQVIKEKET